MSSTLETRQELRPVSGEFPPKWIETLETRRLLSATGDVLMQPAISLTPNAVNTTATGYTPAQIKKAYGFDQLTLQNGVVGDGSGQTIAIVDAYDDPNILNDLKTFSSKFSLADPLLTKVSQTGSTTNLPKTDAGWSQEIALDVEWAHTIAPKAKILLVEAKSATLTDLLAAVDYARNTAGVSVVSMSWGTNEFINEGSYDKYFTTPIGHQGVTFVASSGDEGSWYGPTWPSVSSNVLAVGGTTLRIGDTSGTYAGETGWSGSGGGVSRFIDEPSYQSQYGGNLTGRGAPDVSLNADPRTGYAVYSSVPYQGVSGWQSIGGTSAGAPQWAALIAVANQGRALAGAGSLDGATGTLPAIYSLYNSSTYSGDFHDITAGRSSFFIGAHVGWDGVTGLGSPKGDPIVDALAAFGLASSTTGSTNVVTNTTTTSTTRNTAAQPAAASVATTHTQLPVAQQATSIFSSVQLTPAIELVGNESSTTKVATISSGSTGIGVSGIGSDELGTIGGLGGGSKQIRFASQRQPESNSSLFASRSSISDTNPLRHLLSKYTQDDTRLRSRPGRIFAPTNYDAATLAANAEENDLMNWKEIAALLGAGVLVSSYAMDVQRKKRALMSMYPGIEAER